MNNLHDTTARLVVKYVKLCVVIQLFESWVTFQVALKKCNDLLLQKVVWLFERLLI